MGASKVGKLVTAVALCVSLGTSAAFAAGTYLDTIQVHVRGTAYSYDQTAYLRSKPLDVTLTYENVEGTQQLPDVAAELQIYRQNGSTLTLVSKSGMTLYSSFGTTTSNRMNVGVSEHAVVTIARSSLPAYFLSAGTYVIMVHVKSPTVVYPPQIGVGGDVLTATAQTVMTVI